MFIDMIALSRDRGELHLEIGDRFDLESITYEVIGRHGKVYLLVPVK